MSLRAVKLRHCYDSDEDDILNEFFIPCLEQSCSYSRLAGFFSSTSLAVAARGIQGLLKNNGKMRLIVGVVPSVEDIKIISEGFETPHKIIERMIINNLDEIEDKFVKDHIGALGWMIAQGKLELKFALVSSSKPNIIFHQKVGILEDNEGNTISFSGSDNESEGGWTEHVEEFKVFRNWILEEKKFFEPDIRKFNKFWDNKAKRTIIIEASEAIKEKLIRLSPSNIAELDLDKWRNRTKEIKKPIHLYEYQEKAITKWFDNNKNGIFEMATGTGKTFTALGVLKRLLNENKKLVTVIACPSSHLISQWKKEIIKFGLKPNILIASSTNTDWRTQIANYLYDIKNEIYDNLIILVTHDTFPSPDFIKIIGSSAVDVFLIVDEVHGIGAPERKKGLISLYQYRLGLSATPKRWYDTEGSDELYDYFKGIVFDLPLKEAITTINPATGKTFLTKYDYKPIFIELTKDELFDYEEQTKKIVRMYSNSLNKKDREDLFNILLNKRANIIKNAINKFTCFEDILNKISPVSYCLVYVSPQQIERVQHILLNRKIIQSKFTMDEGTTPSDQFGGMSERDYLLKKFENADYQMLVAMNCLDEGVDIPPARTAILLSSSGNPRQYIQRRGRVLRHSAGKEKAIIYDILVKPTKKHRFSDEHLAEIEKIIFQKELKRYEEFAEIANNSLECLNIIYNVQKEFYKTTI